MKKLQLSLAILLSAIFIQISCTLSNKSGVSEKFGLSADTLDLATKKCRDISIMKSWPESQL